MTKSRFTFEHVSNLRLLANKCSLPLPKCEVESSLDDGKEAIIRIPTNYGFTPVVYEDDVRTRVHPHDEQITNDFHDFSSSRNRNKDFSACIR